MKLRIRSVFFYSFVWGLLAMAPSAFAADDLEVEYPAVNAGEVELSVLGMAYSDDEDPEANHAQTWRVGAGYGVNKYWFSALYAEYEKPADSSTMTVQFYQWENVVRLTQPGQSWADWAVDFEYAYATDEGDKDAYDIMPIVQKRFSHCLLTLNTSFERNPTENGTNKIQFSYAWQFLWLSNPAYQLGVEAYGKLGDVTHWAPHSKQVHQLGPILAGKIHTGPDNILNYRLGMYYGLTDEAVDRSLVLSVEYEL